MLRFPVIIGIILTIIFSFAVPVSAQHVDDGFQAAKKISSQYFTIYTESDIDLDRLAMKVAVPPGIRVIIKEPVSPSPSYDLEEELDTLFLAVSEIMDIRLKRFESKIKICKNNARLYEIADKLFGKPVRTGGFYVLALDTLYVSAEDVNINILGHELSHAIQNQYFVVPPSETIQEVLAGFVEFQMRKYTNSLPR
jgi:hypothetical protein